MRGFLLVLLALGGCKQQYGGGGTAVGNPARTWVRAPVPIATGTIADASFEVLRCDGSTDRSDAVTADLLTGEGPELPGGDLCAIQFTHGAITGDLTAPEGTASLVTPMFEVDRGSYILELGEPDAQASDDAAGLYLELVEDGLLDPIERSRGAVAYGTDRIVTEPFVADSLMMVGFGGARMQRTDGEFPDYPVTDDLTADLRDVAFGDGVWVAVGGDGYVGGFSSVSTDGGFTWTTYTHTNPLNGVAYANGSFVASSIQGTLEVFDGQAWSDAGAPMLGYKGVDGAENGFVALAGTNVAFSTDGVNWDDVPLPGVAGFGAQTAAYGNGVWVAVGDLGYRVRSDDQGLTWTNETSGGNSLTSIAFDGVEFFAVGVNESWLSTDGIAWTAGPSKDLHDVTTLNGEWKAMDESGAIYWYGGGPYWTQTNPPPDANVWTRFASSEP